MHRWTFASRSSILPSCPQTKIMTIEILFFELLQVAIGNRHYLSKTPSAQEWKELFALSKKQALTAITFAGVKGLCKSPDWDEDTVKGFGSSIAIEERLYLKWLGVTAKVVQRNKVMNGACMRLYSHFQSKNIKSCVLKGQGLTIYYPKELRDYRTSGDIDVWTDLDREAAIMLVKKINREAKISLHHADYSLQGYPEIELHFMPSYLINPIANKKLQKWTTSIRETIMSNRVMLDNEYVCCVATIEFNVVFLLTHMYRHFLYEGIGLRQFLDYYFVLRAFHEKQSETLDRTSSVSNSTKEVGKDIASIKEIMHLIERLNLKRFTSAVMWLMQKVFAMPDDFLLCEPNEKEGRFVLDNVMKMGNFGKQDKDMQDIASVKNPICRYIKKKKYALRYLSHYPSEIFWSIPHSLYYKWMTK